MSAIQVFDGEGRFDRRERSDHHRQG